MSKFFCFSQNNSGGSFDFEKERGITRYVIIEANSLDHAVEKAGRIGLYFDGVEKGIDCSCCGDRWYIPFDDGADTPMIYGQPAESYAPSLDWLGPQNRLRHIAVHYLDGRIEWPQKNQDEVYL